MLRTIRPSISGYGVFNLDDSSVAGLLVRTLLYFNRHDDPRLARVIEPIAEDAARGNISALWALAEVSRERRPLQAEDSVACGAQVVLDMLARGDYSTFGAFPSFDDRDALLGLRVLALRGHVNDSRASQVVEAIWQRQDEGARWSLEKSYNGSLTPRLDDAGVASKWATLNVLRIVTRR